MMCVHTEMHACAWYCTHVDFRGQLCEVASVVLPFMGSGSRIQIIRCA